MQIKHVPPVLWFCTAMLLGLVLGWTWHARASDCPVSGPGYYLYSFKSGTIEAEEGLIVLDDEDDLRLPLPPDLEAFLPGDRDRIDPPYLLRFSGTEADYTDLRVE